MEAVVGIGLLKTGQRRVLVVSVRAIGRGVAIGRFVMAVAVGLFRRRMMMPIQVRRDFDQIIGNPPQM